MELNKDIPVDAIGTTGQQKGQSEEKMCSEIVGERRHKFDQVPPTTNFISRIQIR